MHPVFMYNLDQHLPRHQHIGVLILTVFNIILLHTYMYMYSLHSLLLMSFLSPYYPFPKIRTDVPLSKKAKTDLELEDDEASADMESFETNFV